MKATPITPNLMCPEHLTMFNFDLKRYLGTWYAYRESFSQIFEDNQECIKANYSMRDDGLVKVLNSGQKHDPNTEGKYQPRTFIEGRAEFAGDPTRGELLVSFSGDNWDRYDIIDTDYETYSLVYGCKIIEV